MNDETAKPDERDLHDARDDEPIAGASRQPWLMGLARICLLAALFGAGYLAAVAVTSGVVAGCGPESGCNRVLSSRWAYWLGLPVSLPALVVYVCLLAATFTIDRQGSPRTRQASLHVIFALSLLVLAAAFWFVAVQRLVIHAWCSFCLATHASASVAACLLLIAIVRRRPAGRPAASFALSWRTVGLSVGGAMFGLAVLVAGQVSVKKRLYALTSISRQPVVASTRVSLHQGRFTLDPREMPTLGSSAATHFIVSVFDYTCSHCRALHPLLAAAEEKFPGRLAIITLPMPLDAACNPLIFVTASGNQDACAYAKLSLAVWHARREAFRQFDNWLFASPTPPPLDQARAKAEAMVGKEALDLALTSSWVTRQLQTNIALYEANSRLVRDGRLPQLVIGSVIMRGAIENLEQLLALIEQHMPLNPSETTATHAAAR